MSKVNTINFILVDTTVSYSSGPDRVGPGDGLGWRGKGFSKSRHPVFIPKDRGQECCDLPRLMKCPVGKANLPYFYRKLVGKFLGRADVTGCTEASLRLDSLLG